MGLVQQFSAYSSWRSAVSGHLLSLHNWLVENELGDAQSELRLQQLLERLGEGLEGGEGGRGLAVLG